MCCVCVDWERGKMTNREALRALGEMIDTNGTYEEQEHYIDMTEKIEEEEYGED